MNGRMARKCRQIARRDWREMYKDIIKQSFWFRLKLAWWLIRHHIKEDKK